MWFGPDYVVVAWRALGSGYTHLTGPATVKLYVYQWVGEWKGQFLRNIYNVGASFSVNGNSIDGSHYTNFQVTLEDNFFGILSDQCANVTDPFGNTYVVYGNTFDLYLYYKNESARVNWLPYTKSMDMGTNTLVPSLLSGDNFVAVGSYYNDNVHQSHVFTFLGNTFSDTPMTGTYGVTSGVSGKNYFTGANNYFINFFDFTQSGTTVYLTKTTFSYLNEEKKWLYSNNIGTYSGQNGNFYSPSYWYGANSYALALAGQNPEYIYRWDLTYSNFFRDNDNTNSILGFWDDNSYVFNIDNSMIRLVDYHVNGRALRFDGNNWIFSVNHTTNNPGSVGDGPDFIVSSSSANQTRYLSTFNPNTLAWLQTSPAPYVTPTIKVVN